VRKNNLYDLICSRVLELDLISEVEAIYKDAFWMESNLNNKYSRDKKYFKGGYSLDLSLEQTIRKVISLDPLEVVQVSRLEYVEKNKDEKWIHLKHCFEESGYYMRVRDKDGELFGYRGKSGVKWTWIHPSAEYGLADEEDMKFVKKVVSKKNGREYKFIRETEIAELHLWKYIRKESKFNLKFDLNMSLLDDFGFAPKSAPKGRSADPRESLIAYLESNLKKAEESKNLEIPSYKIKDGNRKGSKIQAPTTMWGDINDKGVRRCTLKAMNKKLFNSKEHAEVGHEYHFQSTDKAGVVKEIQAVLDKVNKSKKGSLKMWYKVSADKGGGVASMDI
jgi:hypothetical protein